MTGEHSTVEELPSRVDEAAQVPQQVALLLAAEIRAWGEMP